MILLLYSIHSMESLCNIFSEGSTVKSVVHRSMNLKDLRPREAKTVLKRKNFLLSWFDKSALHLHDK